MRIQRFVLALGFAAALLANPTASKKAADLAGLPPGQSVQVIVQYKQPPLAADLTDLALKGGSLKHIFSKLPAVAASVAAGALDQVAANPDVTYISPDRPLQGSMTITGPTVGANLAASYGWDGTGVTVAVVDSGIANHKDLRQNTGGQLRVIYSESFVAGQQGNATHDNYGHGTHVAGIIAANGTFRGIAANANLVDLQALDANGMGTDSSVIQAVERAIQLKNVYGIRVLNLSLGRPIQESYQTDPLCQAVEDAWEAGITVVVAAGNLGRSGFTGSQGYWTIESPANDPLVITVGAMKTMGTPTRGDDLIASYSSKGPSGVDEVVKPDLVAPGNKITSLLAGPAATLAREYPGNVLSGYPPGQGYMTLSGTSMAAAVVSGAAALLLEKEPALTPDLVKIRLMKTATKNFPAYSFTIAGGATYRSQYDVFTIGAGYLDVLGALTDSSHPVGTSSSPVASFNALASTVHIAASLLSAWVLAPGGLPAFWGNTVLSSPAAPLTSGSVAWGDCVPWGSSVAWGDSVAWGESVAWGDSAAWGDSVAWGDSTALGEN